MGILSKFGSALDSMIAVVSPSWALKRLQSRNAFKALNEYYRGASRDRLRSDWITQRTDPDAPKWEHNLLIDRFRDLERNDPIASGLVDTMGVNVVGKGLKPKPRIRADVLGISKEEADFYADMAINAFEKFVPYADACERVDFDYLQFLALCQIIRDGECITLPVWANEAYRPYSRCLQLLESEYLGEYASGIDERARGVILGDRGQPISYLIKENLKYGAKVKEIPAKDSAGRPKVIHAFMAKRPGQTRGIPLFAPVLDLFKDFADYREAELIKARISACLAVFFTKADPMAAVQLARETGTQLTDRSEPLTELSPGMIHYADYGDDIKVVDPNRGGDVFGQFTENVIRLIGASIGLPFELVMKDFSKTNYSSARAALLEGRRVFQNWRSWFSKSWCQPIYELVLEEAYYRGYFDVPNFEQHKKEYCRAEWLGNGWGWVDPVKEITASKLAIDYGLSTHEKECASQGNDAYEILDEEATYANYKAEVMPQEVLNEGENNG